MADFDYGNARIRAMKARLLSRRELNALAEAGSLDGMIAALTKTAYRKPVEGALSRTTGMKCINEALHDDLTNTLGKVRRFYAGPASEMVTIVLRIYDVHNLKTILRGLAKNVPSGEILPALLPVGEVDPNILLQLARAAEPRTAIDILATLGMPVAQPLLKLRAEKPGAETFQMELALEQWHFEEAEIYLKEAPVDVRLLKSALYLEADIKNLLTAMRFSHNPAERKFLRERVDSGDLRLLFVGPGHIPFDQLVRAGEQDTLNAAVELLSESPYEHILHLGLNDYAQSGRLSDIEKHLNRYQLDWMRAQIAKDPLGIGMLLGYHALKINEVGNIRWIAQGIYLGLKPEAIREGLEFVS